MATYGYGRVSTDKTEQRLDRQEDKLMAAGCERLFLDRESGSSWARPALSELLGVATEGDTIVVVSIDRLGRSTRQLLETVDDLRGRRVNLRSLGEDFDLATPQGQFFLTICSAFAELELGMCRERVRQGLASARARGRVGGHPRVDAGVMDTAVRMWLSRDYSISEITEACGIARQTLYNEIRRRGVSRDVA